MSAAQESGVKGREEEDSGNINTVEADNEGVGEVNDSLTPQSSGLTEPKDKMEAKQNMPKVNEKISDDDDDEDDVDISYLQDDNEGLTPQSSGITEPVDEMEAKQNMPKVNEKISDDDDDEDDVDISYLQDDNEGDSEIEFYFSSPSETETHSSEVSKPTRLTDGIAKNIDGRSATNDTRVKPAEEHEEHSNDDEEIELIREIPPSGSKAPNQGLRPVRPRFNSTSDVSMDSYSSKVYSNTRPRPRLWQNPERGTGCNGRPDPYPSAFRIRPIAAGQIEPPSLVKDGNINKTQSFLQHRKISSKDIHLPVSTSVPIPRLDNYKSTEIFEKIVREEEKERIKKLEEAARSRKNPESRSKSPSLLGGREDINPALTMPDNNDLVIDNDDVVILDERPVDRSNGKKNAHILPEGGPPKKAKMSESATSQTPRYSLLDKRSLISAISWPISPFAKRPMFRGLTPWPVNPRMADFITSAPTPCRYPIPYRKTIIKPEVITLSDSDPEEDTSVVEKRGVTAGEEKMAKPLNNDESWEDEEEVEDINDENGESVESDSDDTAMGSPSAASDDNENIDDDDVSVLNHDAQPISNKDEVDSEENNSATAETSSTVQDIAAQIEHLDPENVVTELNIPSAYEGEKSAENVDGVLFSDDDVSDVK